MVCTLTNTIYKPFPQWPAFRAAPVHWGRDHTPLHPSEFCFSFAYCKNLVSLLPTFFSWSPSAVTTAAQYLLSANHTICTSSESISFFIILLSLFNVSLWLWLPAYWDNPELYTSAALSIFPFFSCLQTYLNFHLYFWHLYRCSHCHKQASAISSQISSIRSAISSADCSKSPPLSSSWCNQHQAAFILEITVREMYSKGKAGKKKKLMWVKHAGLCRGLSVSKRTF